MEKEKRNISRDEALEFHKLSGKPGKIEIRPTKPLVTQYDLSLAYSPGVAYPCEEIHKDPNKIYDYTSKGNLVAVISNGTAVLGLGNLGAAASKPVMEGKAVLFKKFADIDSIDIEVSTEDPDEFINAVKYLGSSWGGINLEDIKSPECFIIENKLREIMDIPVFHDDQHGTAIITVAGLINALEITKKKIEDIKIVSTGSGAAGIACIELIKDLGVPDKNVIMCDSLGVIYKGRKEGMNPWKEKHAIDTELRTLEEAMNGADVFLGLSVKGALSKNMVKSMADKPIIFAMANPDPEILPEEVKEVRDDAIIATGRSDYSNQVNNVMGFPYIFRGALDVRASTINDEMKLAAAHAIAALAKMPVPEEVYKAYSGKKMKFGPEYIIPVPFDPRLITTVPVAVAGAAIKSGVAKIENFDLQQYARDLAGRLDKSSNYMNLVYQRVSNNLQKILFAEGEEEETINAAILMRDNGYANPILVGRMSKIEPILEKMGVGLNLDGIEVINAANCKDLDDLIDSLYSKLQRKGYLYRDCARLVKSDKNIFASMLLDKGYVDGMITGHTKAYFSCLEDILKVIPRKDDKIIFSYSILLTENRSIIISDSSVNELPSPSELADIAIQTAEVARKMGVTPRVALLSFSNFGNPNKEKAQRIKDAVKILEERRVDFEFDGEMSPDIALNKNLMKIYPFCRLSEPANILIMPALNTASISTKLFQELGGGEIIGPIICGLSKPVQIVQMGASSEDIMRSATFAAIEAIRQKAK
jgi:malate dehydrogenase (oxaloacetate-decarboxylating)(NADP+)